MTRQARIERHTNETKIDISLNLDGTGKARLNTGLGFFDHMLEQIARHGLLDIDLHVEGDLHVDCHHSIEDTGIALGDALREASRDKRGTDRHGQV